MSGTSAVVSDNGDVYATYSNWRSDDIELMLSPRARAVAAVLRSFPQSLQKTLDIVVANW